MNYTKDDVLNLIIKFEDCNPHYPREQLTAAIIEIQKEKPHNNYIDEKIQNVEDFFNDVLCNFRSRMKDPEYRDAWKRFLNYEMEK